MCVHSCDFLRVYDQFATFAFLFSSIVGIVAKETGAASVGN